MSIKLTHAATAVSLAAALFAPAVAAGKGTIVTTPHNLSASGRYPVKFSQELQICIFCHVPHNATPKTPLWSRELGQSYTKYDSTTLQAQVPTLPTGASRLCLSCHDGTIALNSYATSPMTGNTYMPTGSTPTTNPNLTTNLSDDHPISFVYDSNLVSKKKGELALPSSLPAAIRLDNGTLECTACHDPHDNEFGNFLVMNNSVSGSPLCVACHLNTGWPNSTHNPANTSVLAPACMNCHYSHNAPQPARLLHSKQEENNCYLNCHNGTDTNSVNVLTLFSKTYRHPVDATTGVHDENESLPATSKHVECVDCHNPHQSNNANAPLSSPPLIDGRLKGVRIDNTGNIAVNEYDVCFRCHTGTQSSQFVGVYNPPNRMIPDPDEKNRFRSVNPSIHPVTATRTTSKGAASLKTAMSQIYCTDCHNSDQGTKALGTGSGANGPHGSNFAHILIARYDMPLTSQPYATIQYDLCYRCHLEGFIMGSSSGFINQGTNEHVQHVQVRGTPCFVCHDPHGVPSSPTTPVPGGTTTNNAHLINFNKDYAAQPPLTSPVYTTTAPSTGSCTVSCHTNGATHYYQP